MRVIFYDDADSDSDIADMELPVAPRNGEVVVLPGRRKGTVVRVDWCLDESTPYVEVTLKLM